MGNLIRVLALLFLASPVVYCENLGQLLLDTRVLALDAASSTRQRFSDSQITVLLNQGQRQLISQTRCIRNSTSFYLSRGTTYYALPNNFLTVRRVTRGGIAIPELSPEALDGRSRGWEVSAGAPVQYFVNFSTRGYIGFVPFPSSSSDLYTIKVEYDADASDLVSSSDIPFNGIGELTSYQQALPYYAASQMMMINGLQVQSDRWLALFTSLAGQMKVNCKDRGYSPSAVAQP